MLVITTSERAPASARSLELAAQRTLDAIEDAPERYPAHRFAVMPGVRRALLLRPPKFPYAISYLLRPDKAPYILAVEHLRRAPMYWAERLRAFVP